MHFRIIALTRGMTVALTFLLVCTSTSAGDRSPAIASSATPSADVARIERLAGLAKAWGAVKYFHPAIVQRRIDWDGALIAAIPKVNAARTRTEYIAAMNVMIAVLGDRATLARPISEAAAPAIAVAPIDAVRMHEGALWIDPLAAAHAAESATGEDDNPMTKVLQLAPTAPAIVLDLRSALQVSDDAVDQRDRFLRDLLPELLDDNLMLAAMRFRAHSGHPPQDGRTSGGYYSTMATTTPDWIVGKSKTKPPQIVVLVDQRSTALDIVAGLQGSGDAFVVQDGAAPAATYVSTLPLMPGVELRLTTSEPVNADGSIGFAADLISAAGGATAATTALLAKRKFESKRVKPAVANNALVEGRDATYAEMLYPTTEYRLFALFRYWNAIHYFYPNKDLIGRGWDTVLPEYITRFEANRDVIDYQNTVLRLAAQTQDSHSFTVGADAAMAKIGMYVVPLQLREVQGRSVVTLVLDPALPVQRGDEVLSIDQAPVATRIAELTPIIAAATPQALSIGVHNSLLRGGQDSVATLVLRNPAGATRKLELRRTMARADVYPATLRKWPAVRILPSGFGYVDLVRLQPNAVDAMFDTIHSTQATIFDMRGYPNGTAWAIAPRLTTKVSPVNALFSRPYIESFNLDVDELANTSYTFSQRLPKVTGKPYLGKVVMLINAEAISQAEHTCLMFEVATDVTFIGTPTMGANGDVTNVTLPGGLIAHFGGHNVRHADGRPLQRVGIQPTIRVDPTITGVAAGRDEILDAAVAFLAKRAKR